jgi:hypothetical protein
MGGIRCSGSGQCLTRDMCDGPAARIMLFLISAVCPAGCPGLPDTVLFVTLPPSISGLVETGKPELEGKGRGQRAS